MDTQTDSLTGGHAHATCRPAAQRRPRAHDSFAVRRRILLIARAVALPSPPQVTRKLISTSAIKMPLSQMESKQRGLTILGRRGLQSTHAAPKGFGEASQPEPRAETRIPRRHGNASPAGVDAPPLIRQQSTRGHEASQSPLGPWPDDVAGPWRGEKYARLSVRIFHRLFLARRRKRNATPAFPLPRAAPHSNIGFANALADGPREHGERHDARVRHTRRAPSLTPTPAPWRRGRPRGSRSLHPPAAASASGEDSRLPSDNISGDSDSASQRGKLRPRSIITSPSSFPPQYNKSSNPGTVASAFLFVDF